MVISTVPELRSHVKQFRKTEQGSVVLVPTMGALHDGHLQLVRRARDIGRFVVVSIFVNPLQFNQSQDLERYPRNLEADLQLLGDQPNIVFAPTVDVMYPDGPRKDVKVVAAGEVGKLYEGKYRPGHFDGMLTVVAKLFHIVQPDIAIFGAKDAQQAFLVKRMVSELNFPVEIEVAKTVRDSDGLAMSSRNRFLQNDERTLALKLSQALHAATAAAESGASTKEALEAAKGCLASSDITLEYVDVVNPDTFLSVADRDYHGAALVIVAAVVGTTRLIDNAVINITV